MNCETAAIPACLLLFVVTCVAMTTSRASAQDNYEIQVYGSATIEPAVTMVELHSNFTLAGSENIANGVLPTQSSLHETIEITHGFSECFEVGGYLFTSLPRGGAWQWVGSHLRPRVSAPSHWAWPIGASLSIEAGYAKREFSVDTWDVEIRPIIDRQSGPWYFSLNPVFDHSLKGEGAARGFEFSPNAKVSFQLVEEIAIGLEYYGSIGPLTDPYPVHDQEHQLVPAIDLDVSPEWEINVGVCFGITPGTDHVIAKMILGRRFGG